MDTRCVDGGVRRRARFLTLTLITGAGLSLFWMIFDIAMGFQLSVFLTMSTYIVLCGALLGLRNRIGHDITALLTAAVFLGATLFVTVLIGPEVGTHFYLLGVALLPLLFVPLDRQFGAAILHMALAVGLFILFEAGVLTLRLLEPLSDEVAYLAIQLNPALSLTILVGLVSSFIADLALAEEQLAIAREEADSLLRNVLPEDIAQRLKQGSTEIADRHPMATVVFSDIVGFTPLAEKCPPADLVKMLDGLVKKFDHLCVDYGIEKIKTIGDAYMAVGGLTGDPQQGAVQAVGFALAMRDLLQEEGARLNQLDDSTLQVRIGIHSGPLIAGVIGEHKFSYDLWGDTVNTAARLETHGKAGCVHVSEATCRLIEDHFTVEARGEVELKGKGAVETWFVMSARPGLG